MTSKRAWLAGSAGVALLCAAGAAPAQTPAAGGSGQVEELIVTARKIEENVQDIPVAVTAMSGAALERQNVREIRDLAGKAPNLTITQGSSDPGSQTVALRGQSAPDLVLTTDPAVALYVDNVVLPRGYGLRANMVDVQRLEVLRGPQGTLYGKNTTGGLVNVITKNPGPELGGSISARFGNYGMAEFVGVANVPLNEQMGLRLVAQRGHHDPYGYDGVGRGLAKEDSSYLRLKFLGEWDRLTVNAFADYNSMALGGAIFRLSGLTPATATAPEGGRLTQEAALELYGANTPTTQAAALQVLRSYIGGDPYRNHSQFASDQNSYARDVGLDIRYDLTDDLSVRSITGYRSLAFGAPSDLDTTPFVGTEPRRAAQDDFISQELQVLGGDETFNWVAGAYGSWEHGKEFSTTRTLLSLLAPTRPTQLNLTNGKVTSSSWAVFGQANWRFAPRWSATLGARYTSEDKGLVSYNQVTVNGATFACNVPVALRVDPATCRGEFSDTFEEPTWTASLTYDATDDVSLYAKASHGFRSGGQNYRGTTTVESFAPFDPETVNEYELGLKSELFDRRVRLNLAAFYDEMTDVQRTVIVASAGGQTATVQTNAASATISGFEAEGTWRVTPAFTLDGAFGVIDPKYETFVDLTGDRSNEDWPTPKTQYSLSATYVAPTPAGDLTSTVTWSGRSKQNLSPASKNKSQVTQEAYGLLNARVSLDIADKGLTVSLFGRNLTDEVYYVSAVGLESLGWNIVATGEPRTWGIELVKRFGGE